MLASGIAPQSTSGDEPVTLIANSQGQRIRRVSIVNTGEAAGFVSIDAGVTWVYLPAGPSSRAFDLPEAITAVVLAKRIPGGSDLGGLYADAH